jgi:hypothetical protein
LNQRVLEGIKKKEEENEKNKPQLKRKGCLKLKREKLLKRLHHPN